jgi:plastocyanin
MIRATGVRAAPPMHRYPILLAGLALAGCGSDAMMTASPPMAAPTASMMRPPARTVRIAGFAFAPANLTVARGARVTWMDHDASNHTVTFTHGPDLGNVDQGGKLSRRFDTAGTYAYVCRYHPNMRASITVR